MLVEGELSKSALPFTGWGDKNWLRIFFGSSKKKWRIYAPVAVKLSKWSIRGFVMWWSKFLVTIPMQKCTIEICMLQNTNKVKISAFWQNGQPPVFLTKLVLEVLTIRCYITKFLNWNYRPSSHSNPKLFSATIFVLTSFSNFIFHS